MAESMAGLKRSCRCAEVTEANVGQEMTLMGWVQKSRNKGGIIFTDLRDRSGIIQIIFEESDCGAESFAKAEKLRSEFTVAVVGTIEKRSGAANPNLKTGTIEMRAKSLRILSESEVPPFPIEENSKTKEDLRLKYRYLDLRRPDLQRNDKKPCGYDGPSVLSGRRFPRDRDPDSYQEYTGRRKRLPCTEPCASGRVLCSSAVSAVIKTAADVFRYGPLLPARKMLP